MEFQIEPGKEIFRWGPLPLKCTYGSTFFQVIQNKYLKKYGFSWSDALLVFYQGSFVWIQDDQLLRDTAGKVFLEHVMTPQYAEYKKEMATAVETLEKYYRVTSEEKILSLSGNDLTEEAGRFNGLAIRFEQPTIAPEIGNYGSIPILRKELSPYVPAEDLDDAVVFLTSSEKDSFFQLEEMELQETSDLEVHREKYFWLKNSYAHVEILPVSFFTERKSKLQSDLRTKHWERIANVRKDKEALIAKHSIPNAVVSIADRIVDAMELQDERKMHMMKSHHYKDLFMQSFQNQGIQHAERYMLSELIEIVEGTRTPSRNENFGFYFINGELEEFDAENAARYWDEYAFERAKEGLREFKGIVASKGVPVRGKVRIILNPESASAEAFESGDILVAPMTSPEYVFLMKKASAIVTDSGGLTSHAAIVSRELGVPCIIGAKIATTALEDGDMVEVDAEKGIVRKL